MASLPSDTLCAQVRRPGDHATATGSCHDPGAPRETQRPGLRAVSRYSKAAVILRPIESCPLGPRTPRAKGSMYMILLLLLKCCRLFQPHLITAHPFVLV